MSELTPRTLKMLCFGNDRLCNVQKKKKVMQQISEKMRYSQIVNSVNTEGRNTTVTDVNKVPIGFRPVRAIIVPPTNFRIFS
jgi:hypothetical protein